MDKFEKEAVMILKALSDVNRLKILNIISKEEKCACVLLEDLKLTQSGLSYHMKILQEAGLVNPRQEGKWTHYTLKRDRLNLIAEYLKNI